MPLSTIPQQGNTKAHLKAMKGRRNAAALFACVAILWLLVDIATKAYFNSGQFFVGQFIAGPFLGLFEFVLVHNTGAAWGIFGDSTFALGVFSLLMCLAILAFFLYLSKDISWSETFGIALVFSGGLGNAIDRFNLNYVVDFINFSFMDFPVFNIADIGVTCGIVIFLVAFFMREHGGQKEGEPCE